VRLSLHVVICITVAVAAGLSGWVLIRTRPGETERTGFVTPFSPAWFCGFFSSGTLRPGLGWLLLMLAAFLLFILAPMFYIAG